MLALLLSACAVAPQLPEPAARPALKLESRIAAPERAVLPGLGSDFSLGSEAGLLHYRAGYSFNPGSAFDTGAMAPSEHVARQAIGQDLGLRLDQLAGTPLSLGMAWRQQSDWQVGGESLAAQRSVNLGWAPQLARFDLRWSESNPDAVLPLDCALDGSMRMPLVAEELALKLHGRSCRVLQPESELATLDARTWAAALEWGSQERMSTLRLQAIDPAPGGGVAAADPAAGYELGLLRQYRLGAWSTQSTLAWRRVPDARNPAVSEGWSSDTMLRRQVRSIGVSAGLSRGSNPLWFLPDAGVRSNQLNLGLDLSRWAGGLMPGRAPQTGLYYTRSQSLGGEEALEDETLQWKFSVLW